MNKEVYNLLKEIKPRLDKYHLRRLRIFGSQARDDYRKDSDVDLIVEFSQTPTYFKLARMKREIEEYLNKKVDIVFEHKIFPELKENILKDATDV